MNEQNEVTVAVYVDSQHLFFAARSHADAIGSPNRKFDYEALLGVVLEEVRRRYPGRVVRFTRQRVYVATRSRALGFLNALEQLGYAPREHILRSGSDAFDWDTQLVTDAFVDNPERSNCRRCDGTGEERGAWDGSPPPCRECGDTAEVVVVVSGDGDFAPLARRWPNMLTFGFPRSSSNRLPNLTHLDERVLYA